MEASFCSVYWYQFKSGPKSQGGFLQYNVDTISGFMAILRVPNIAHHQFKAPVIQHPPDILHPSCREIIKTHHLVVVFQQILAQVGTDKAGTAGY